MAVLSILAACGARVGSTVTVAGLLVLRGTLQVYPLAGNFTVCRVLLAGGEGHLIEVRA